METIVLQVSALYHYPVKGLSAQALHSVDLIPGHGFPFDRVYGIARHDSGYDPDVFRPLPKSRFIVLMKEDRLAGLTTQFDPSTHVLRIRNQEQHLLSERLDTSGGREAVEQFFADMFDLSETERPTLAAGGDSKRFTDSSVASELMMNAISLINVASVQDLGARIGRSVDPIRFRANLYFDGLPPFAELDLLDREIAIGRARLRVLCRTQRCAATNVDPVTAVRDMALPHDLMKQYGHADMGVYAEVLKGGPIMVGAPIVLV